MSALLAMDVEEGMGWACLLSGLVIDIAAAAGGNPGAWGTVFYLFAFLLYKGLRDDELAREVKDAERYRFLRAAQVHGAWGQPKIAVPTNEESGEFVNGQDADDAVDAAKLAATDPRL